MRKEAKEILQLKYDILRRAIHGKITTALEATDITGKYTAVDLKKLAYEIEGKTLKELQEIHKKWIGY